MSQYGQLSGSERLRQIQWDPQAMLPQDFEVAHKNVAPEFQAYAERLAQARRDALYGSAHGSLRQAEQVFSNYRPGGAQMLASGLFGQQAQLFAHQADVTEAPNMMGDYVRDAEHQARVAAKRAGRMSMAMGVLSLGASAAMGGMLGAPAPVAPGAAGQPQPSRLGAPTGGGYESAGGSAIGAPAGGGYGAGLGPEGPGTAQGTAGARLGQEGAGSGKPPQAAPGGPGAASQGGGQEQAQGQPGGGQAMGASLGGYGFNGDFTPTALAASGARAIPISEMMTRAEYARDLENDRSTAAFEGVLGGILGQLARMV